MRQVEGDLVEASEVARVLVGGAVNVNRIASGGRNSRIWHVRSGQREFALKQYPLGGDGSRDRLAAEVGALRLMESQGIDSVPRVVGVDHKLGYALLSWIEGSDIVEVSAADIDAAVVFLGSIHALRESPQARNQPPAAEACLCGSEIVRQIERRLAQLREVSALEGDLDAFIENSFVVAFSDASREGRKAMTSAGLDFARNLSQEWQTLVPSDFGFHNCLRRTDGMLAFVDFEYFGWDDPVKLTADVLLHPGRPLSPQRRRQFREAASKLYRDDPTFLRRFSAYSPLFGLRWVLILLNEFIPERWQRRVLAGEVGSWDSVKARQLASARDFLGSIPLRIKD